MRQPALLAAHPRHIARGGRGPERLSACAPQLLLHTHSQGLPGLLSTAKALCIRPFSPVWVELESLALVGDAQLCGCRRHRHAQHGVCNVSGKQRKGAR